MRFEKVFKNGFVGVFSQIIILLIGAVTQRVFVHYLGQTTLGMNAVVSSMLNMLTLAELGVGSAITFRLYKPLAQKDEETIASIMQLFKRLYWTIGTVVFVVGCILMLTLTIFFNEPDVDINFVRVIYLIELVATASTYFLSYKRTLLYADQKNYVCALYDTLTNVIFSLLRIITVIQFQNYILYTALNVVQQIVANLLISHYCNKAYPKLKEKNIPVYENTKGIFADMKNILVGKIAVYIYSNTDELVISAFSTVTGGLNTVGGLSLYTYITNAAKGLINSFVYSMAPAIGNFLNENDEDRKGIFKLFNNYTFARRYIASILVTGLIICISPLVAVFFGSEFVLLQPIVVLICLDMYISIVHGPINEFISVLGLFHYEKYINAGGAAINIIISIILVQFMGVEGVLLGTAVSQLFFWIGKSVLLFRKYFDSGYMVYWRKVIVYMAVDVVQVIGLQLLSNRLFPEPTILNFMVQVVMCIIIPTGITVLLFFKTEEFKFTWQLVLSIIRKLRGAK